MESWLDYNGGLKYLHIFMDLISTQANCLNIFRAPKLPDTYKCSEEKHRASINFAEINVGPKL